MKGLKDYIKKHGFHFTERLAYDVGGRRWSSKQIEKAAQRKVYYNVTCSTLEDIVYSTNAYYLFTEDFKTLGKCLEITLWKVGLYHEYAYGGIFSQWLETMRRHGEVFDFTPYI